MDCSKKVLITGATRGIGKSILSRFSSPEFFVIGTATSEAGACAISESIREAGAKGEGIKLNIQDPADIQNVFASLEKAQKMPDILINNAGITADDLLIRMSEEKWDSVLETNLGAAFRLSKVCLRSMFKKRWGRVILLGSVVGSMGNAGQTNYCAAKAGILGFSKALAREVASRNITVNVVSPGFIQTDMTEKLPEALKASLLNQIPLGVIGQGIDVAHAVYFLASEEARYITGQTLHVNGGLLME